MNSKCSAETVLLCGYEPPSYGGASTAGYQLFREMQSELSAHYLSLIDASEVAVFTSFFGEEYHNPEGLTGTCHYVIERPSYQHQPGLGELFDKLNPSVLVGIGYVAAFIAKQARPDLPLILITTGCQQVKDGLERKAIHTVGDVLSGSAPLTIYNDIEERAFQAADCVVTHSDLMRSLCGMYFPGCAWKIADRVVWFYEWITRAAIRSLPKPRAFAERDIDVVFVASDWNRVEKNRLFVEALSERLRKRAVHLVGKTERELPYVVHHGLLPNAEVLNLLSRSKVLVCPSSFDAAPGILFEGAALGCNLVASKNCGNYRLCHPELLVGDYTVNGFLSSINRALTAPVANRAPYFEGRNDQQYLIELIRRYSRYSHKTNAVTA